MGLKSLLWDRTAISASLALLLVYGITRFIHALYKARSRMLKLKAQGLPMPPYNPILGHLPFAYKMTSKLPSDAHMNLLPDLIRRELPDLGPTYYFDTWPFGPQMLIVSSINGLTQITQEHSLPKYHSMRTFLQPIADGQDIVTMEGEMHKRWRSVFNPGFSNANLMTLLPGIVDETSVFCGLLKKLSQSKKVFRMKSLTDYLTLDVICNIVLDVRLQSQTQKNPLAAGLRSQTNWLIFGGESNPLARLNPWRQIVLWYNKRRMDNFIAPHLDRQLSVVDKVDRKTIIDLASRAYNSSMKDHQHSKQEENMFKSFALSQVKLFLFSGHDTTSSSLCYLFYVLATHPDILQKMRDEHDYVLGTDLDSTGSLLKSDPTLLNQIPYTTAVIKETLRLYPAVSSTRAGEPGFSVIETDTKSSTTRLFPTEDFLVWANPHTIQRDPSLWPSPDKVIPERWLTTASDDTLHPVKGSWRVFEHGPRNCIGQELAMIEMKIVLVMVGRMFDVDVAYEEVDKGSSRKTVYGERGYQIGRAQPSEDLPVRVMVYGQSGD